MKPIKLNCFVERLSKRTINALPASQLLRLYADVAYSLGLDHTQYNQDNLSRIHAELEARLAREGEWK